MPKVLFIYFTGEQLGGEQVYFSVSSDGRYFQELNLGKPILLSTIGEAGVRDPFIIRDPKQDKLYLIATDLRIEKGLGWDKAQDEGSKNIVVWESPDLVAWSEPQLLAVDLPAAGNVWAPEAFYDEEKGAFLVFWASKVAGKHRIYGAYTQDFQQLDTPFIFLERAYDVIDTTIVQDGEFFYRFSKDEITSRIIIERATKLMGPYETIDSPVLEKLIGVEGPELYPVGLAWHLIVDRFADDLGYMILQTEKLGEEDFTYLSAEEYDFGSGTKRHGGVMLLTDEEYQCLLEQYA